MDENTSKHFAELCAEIQASIYKNKEAKGFNVNDIPLEFCLTFGELAEALDAWRKKEGDLGEELADVAIYLFGLASILEIDLGEEIVRKIEKNRKRDNHDIVVTPCSDLVS